MRPVDPVMLRRLPSLARYLRRCGLLAAVAAALIVAQAAALAKAVSAAVLDGFASPGMIDGLIWFAVAATARSVLAWIQNAAAAHASAEVKTSLRKRLFAAARPGWRGGQRTGEAITLITRGVDGLDTYITGYLPQLCLAATVPVTAIAVLAWNDAASAVVVLLTVPLMPIFGILIGWHTKAKTEQQWSRLHRLGGHFLDAVAGLSTSRVFGRAGRAAAEVRDIADRYRGATMNTLKIAFLSALALELIAALSVALVAVPIGLQLLNGTMNLYTAFFVLLLVPEVYVPLRSMGSQFHAAAEGLAACRSAFALTDNSEDDPMDLHNRQHASSAEKEPGGAETVGQPTPGLAPADGYPQADGDTQTDIGPPRQPTPPADDRARPLKTTLDKPYVTSDTIQIGAEVGGPRTSRVTGSPFLTFDNVSVTYPGRSTRALTGLSAVVERGSTVALVGPSGAGKSTVLRAVLGFAPVDDGDVELASSGRIRDHRKPSDRALPDAWLGSMAWVPQRPHLFAMSVADNIRLGQPNADAAAVRAAADAAFATEFVNELPDGFDTRLGDAGFGLSAGQCRRIALARAFLRIHVLDCRLVLLDEPTAGLDLYSEARIAEATAGLLAGRTALVVAHRTAMVESADEVWRIVDGRLRSVDVKATVEVGS